MKTSPLRNPTPVANQLAQRPAQTGVQMSRLSAYIKELEGTASTLIERIGPVLRPEERPPSPCCDKAQEISAPVAQALAVECEALRHVIDNLQDAINRLEL